MATMQPLTVTVLGNALVQADLAAVACSSRKSLGLFLYIACTGARHARQDLARLFWGGQNLDAARTSLRTALQRLPGVLSDCLEADRDAVQLRSPLHVDAHRFAQLARSDDDADLRAAVDLYRGPLLAGLDLDAAPEFDDWLARERARLWQLAQHAFERVIATHRDRARRDAARAAVERDAALAAARRWCDIDPADEAAHRWLMRLYADVGRPEAALAQFETCKRELAVHKGRAPGAETQSLAESLRVGDRIAAPTRDASTTAGPPAATVRPVARDVPGTTFVGRVDELAQIEGLLAQPEARLVTLHAMGGCGKSRLAAVVADQAAARFAQGATWVSLAALTRAANVPVAIAEAIGLAPSRDDPADALCAALKMQHRLLVLDNLEHLLPGHTTHDADVVELILRLLREAPGVRILATSRETIDVQEEWVFPLHGLPCPPEDCPRFEPGAYAAVDLFVQRARQASLAFSIEAEWPHVVALCRCVEGLPLGLELVAAWVRTVPCADLLALVRSGLAAPANRHRNRAARQASLDAVVRASWSLLQPDQQCALAALGVFVGGFTQDAATSVADAPARMVSSLVDKAMIQRTPAGRLRLHALVRQFAVNEASVAGIAWPDLARRHAAFFADRVRHARAVIDYLDGPDAMAALTLDLPDIFEAEAQWPLTAAASSLFEAWLRVLIGRTQFRAVRERALRVLAAQPPPGTGLPVLTYLAVARMYLGEAGLADSDLDRAMELALRDGSPDAFASVQLHRVNAALLRGDVALARRHLDDLRLRIPAIRDAAQRLRAQYIEAMVLEAEGTPEAASALYTRVCEQAREERLSPTLIAGWELTLGNALFQAGRAAEGAQRMKAAAAALERGAGPLQLARAWNSLALAQLWTGDATRLPEAEHYARRALAHFEQSGHAMGIGGSADTIGQILWAAGRVEEARPMFVRAADAGPPLVAHGALVMHGLMNVATDRLPAASAIAIDRLDAAREKDSAAWLLPAVLLAIAVLLKARPVPADAAGWLAGLRARGDLEFGLRRYADAMARDVRAATPLELDGTTLDAMRFALAAVATDR